MVYFDIQQYPILVVLVVFTVALIATNLLCNAGMAHIKFKTQSSKDVFLVTAYTSVTCILLSWGCVYLAQAKPMLGIK